MQESKRRGKLKKVNNQRRDKNEKNKNKIKQKKKCSPLSQTTDVQHPSYHWSYSLRWRVHTTKSEFHVGRVLRWELLLALPRWNLPKGVNRDQKTMYELQIECSPKVSELAHLDGNGTDGQCSFAWCSTIILYISNHGSRPTPVTIWWYLTTRKQGCWNCFQIWIYSNTVLKRCVVPGSTKK